MSNGQMQALLRVLEDAQIQKSAARACTQKSIREARQLRKDADGIRMQEAMEAQFAAEEDAILEARAEITQAIEDCSNFTFHKESSCPWHASQLRSA